MPIIATSTHRTSNVLKRDFWPEDGYTRKAIKKVAGTNYLIGQVVSATGTLTPATAADVAGIVIDFQDDDWLVVLYRGPAAVRAGGIVNGSVISAADLATELESRGILVLEGE